MNDSSQLLRELRIDRSAETEAPRARGTLWIGLFVLLLGIGFAGWWFTRTEAVVVRTAVARSMPTSGSGASASVLDATGYVTARRQATVSSKITGKVIEVLIEEGMRVEQDQVLARLDPVDAEAQRTLSHSQLAAARTQLQEARVQLGLAEKTLARQRELLDRRLIAQSLFDQAESERDALRARVASAQRGVEVAQDSLQLTEIAIDNTVVRAPFAGVVTVKAAQPGEMISPISAGGGFTRTGIGTIVDMESLEVQVDVNEAYINRVTPGQPVEAVLNAYPDWRIPAEVIAIIPTADRSRATVKVRIALKERDDRVVPDMGVRVSFLEAAGARDAAAPAPRPGVLVPASAVQKLEGRDVVWVVRDAQVERRAVTAGGSVGDAREIKAGVSAGETVVTDPSPALADGIEVEVAATDA